MRKCYHNITKSFSRVSPRHLQLSRPRVECHFDTVPIRRLHSADTSTRELCQSNKVDVLTTVLIKGFLVLASPSTETSFILNGDHKISNVEAREIEKSLIIFENSMIISGSCSQAFYTFYYRII